MVSFDAIGQSNCYRFGDASSFDNRYHCSIANAFDSAILSPSDSQFTVSRSKSGVGSQHGAGHFRVLVRISILYPTGPPRGASWTVSPHRLGEYNRLVTLRLSVLRITPYHLHIPSRASNKWDSEEDFAWKRDFPKAGVSSVYSYFFRTSSTLHVLLILKSGSCSSDFD